MRGSESILHFQTLTYYSSMIETANEAVSTGVLGTLGINWKLFISQLINMGIVFFIFAKWVWKPVMKILDERSKKLVQSLKDAAAVAAEKQAIETQRAVLLREAEAKAQVVIKEAMEQAESLKQETTAKARGEVEKILRDGKEVLHSEKATMLQEAKAELANLVVEATGKVLEESMDDKRHRVMVEKVLADM